MEDQTVRSQFSALWGGVIQIGLTTKPVTAWALMRCRRALILAVVSAKAEPIKNRGGRGGDGMCQDLNEPYWPYIKNMLPE